LLEERLRGIVKDREILEGLSAIIRELVERFHPISVIIAGSLAEGRFVKGLSDIDILVVVERVRDEDRFHLRAIGDTDVEITVVGLEELVEAVRRGNEFYRRGLRGVEVYGGIVEAVRRLAHGGGGGEAQA